MVTLLHRHTVLGGLLIQAIPMTCCVSVEELALLLVWLPGRLLPLLVLLKPLKLELLQSPLPQL